MHMFVVFGLEGLSP